MHEQVVANQCNMQDASMQDVVGHLSSNTVVGKPTVRTPFGNRNNVLILSCLLFREKFALVVLPQAASDLAVSMRSQQAAPQVGPHWLPALTRQCAVYVLLCSVVVLAARMGGP